MRIRKPTADWHSVLGMKDVGRRRIVDNNRILELPSNLREVFDIIALVVVAAFSEETMVYNVVDIKLIEERNLIDGFADPGG